MPKVSIDDPSSLGSILIRKYGVPEGKVVKAIEFMEKNKDKMLGEVLIQTEAIDRALLNIALQYQETLLHPAKARGRSVIKLLDHAISYTKSTSEEVVRSSNSLTEMFKLESA